MRPPPRLLLSMAGALLLPAALAGQPDTVTIRAGTLLDGRGGVRRNVMLTIVDGRIASIGLVSGRAVTHDLSDFAVLPGGIDTHVHLNWHFDADGVTHDDPDETEAQAFAFAVENARVTLRSGITTVQSLGATIDGPLRDAIAAGEVTGPRVLTSLQSISERTGPPDAIRARVRELKARGADVIKIFASASIRDGGPPTMSQEQLDAACGEAAAVGLRSAVHAHGPESAQRAVRAGCTVIEHGALLDDETLDLMAARRTFYDPNIGLVLQNYLENRAQFEGVGNYTAEGFAHMERAVPLALDAFRRALERSGIRIVFGTDAVAGAHGRNFEELIYRVQRGGQAPMDAIVSATSLAAESLGMQDSLGTLAPGAVADLIAVRGNPAEDITALRAVVFVMKGGEVVRDDVSSGDGGSIDWPVYAGDAHATKWSPLRDLHAGNVAALEPAWSWRPGERVTLGPDGRPFARPGNFQATPVAIGDTLYLSTPFNQVVALDAATGRELWRHDPRAWEHGQPSNGTGFVHRGVAVWSDGTERRVFMNSRWKLIALDARTGRRIPTFGEDGVVDLAADLLWNVERKHYTNTSPPVIWRDLVIVGNGVGDRLTYRNDPPGDVQAFDVRTGRRVWSFNPIPQPGEFGNETWEDGAWSHVGHTNVWAPFSVDTARGLVYLPVSTPSNDFYGGARPGDNLFAESLVCLDARTGERVWHFQTVHHGVWDYDLPAAPVLMTIEVAGRTIDAVAQPGKTGFLYVFDRVTGEPVWPIEERPVPQGDVPGERLSATQPFPTRPAPFSRQGFGPEDVIDFTPQLRQWALDALEGLRTGPIFTPPSREGTVIMPGLIGGSGWGGGAFDPAIRTLYIKATNQPALIRLIRPEPSDTIDAEWAFDRGANLRVQPPLADTPDGGGARLPPLPISKPPYGALVAIDMDTGEHRWTVPLGDTKSVREHPLLEHLDLPPLGVAGAPGPIATAGGLLFATGGGSTLYALDARDGRTLWQADLDRTGYAVPMTYRTRDGRPFVVIATGSGDDAALQAFALPGGAW